jgi:hypothetical protein
VAEEALEVLAQQLSACLVAGTEFTNDPCRVPVECGNTPTYVDVCVPLEALNAVLGKCYDIVTSVSEDPDERVNCTVCV